ncbi:polyadenylate-binding protein 2 [Aristolochia californica]|uniref:polyadenylate-binding protein 2 n=1 Tax=Aristolochia californica TaxID=171875 RepID=UPI0035D64143
MDSKDAFSMPTMAPTAQTLAPNMDIKIYHPNPAVHLPPPQPTMHSSAVGPFPPPGAEATHSPAAAQRPFGQLYLHQQHHFHYPPPSNPASFLHPEQQNIHTLFISGLPDDVKAREIHNLFRRRQGFESCQLKYTGRGNQVVAFATFYNHHTAMVALKELDGRLFDPETGATLHVELARSNSRTKRPRGTGAYAIIDKRFRTSIDIQETESNDGDGGSDDPSGTDNPNSNNKDTALAATQSGDSSGNLDSEQVGLNEQSEKPTTTELHPCSTLFIANLGPTCTEEELKQVMSQYPGFLVLKMRARGGMPVAFADFEEVDQATEALKSLHGSLLPSSDRGGLHMEYARSKMRKR